MSTRRALAIVSAVDAAIFVVFAVGAVIAGVWIVAGMYGLSAFIIICHQKTIDAEIHTAEIRGGTKVLQDLNSAGEEARAGDENV